MNVNGPGWMRTELYLQYLTQNIWDNKFPSNGGPAWTITNYMKLPKEQLEPIMTNSENIQNFGANVFKSGNRVKYSERNNCWS